MSTFGIVAGTVELPGLGGIPNEAFVVNSANQIAGNSSMPGDPNPHAVLG